MSERKNTQGQRVNWHNSDDISRQEPNVIGRQCSDIIDRQDSDVIGRQDCDVTRTHNYDIKLPSIASWENGDVSGEDEDISQFNSLKEENIITPQPLVNRMKRVTQVVTFLAQKVCISLQNSKPKKGEDVQSSFERKVHSVGAAEGGCPEDEVLEVDRRKADRMSAVNKIRRETGLPGLHSWATTGPMGKLREQNELSRKSFSYESCSGMTEYTQLKQLGNITYDAVKQSVKVIKTDSRRVASSKAEGPTSSTILQILTAIIIHSFCCLKEWSRPARSLVQVKIKRRSMTAQYDSGDDNCSNDTEFPKIPGNKQLLRQRGVPACPKARHGRRIWSVLGALTLVIYAPVRQTEHSQDVRGLHQMVISKASLGCKESLQPDFHLHGFQWEKSGVDSWDMKVSVLNSIPETSSRTIVERNIFTEILCEDQSCLAKRPSLLIADKEGWHQVELLTTGPEPIPDSGGQWRGQSVALQDSRAPGAVPELVRVVMARKAKSIPQNCYERRNAKVAMTLEVHEVGMQMSLMEALQDSKAQGAAPKVVIFVRLRRAEEGQGIPQNSYEKINIKVAMKLGVHEVGMQMSLMEALQDSRAQGAVPKVVHFVMLGKARTTQEIPQDSYQRRNIEVARRLEVHEGGQQIGPLEALQDSGAKGVAPNVVHLVTLRKAKAAQEIPQDIYDIWNIEVAMMLEAHGGGQLMLLLEALPDSRAWETAPSVIKAVVSRRAKHGQGLPQCNFNNDKTPYALVQDETEKSNRRKGNLLVEHPELLSQEESYIGLYSEVLTKSMIKTLRSLKGQSRLLETFQCLQVQVEEGFKDGVPRPNGSGCDSLWLLVEKRNGADRSAQDLKMLKASFCVNGSKISVCVSETSLPNSKVLGSLKTTSRTQQKALDERPRYSAALKGPKIQPLSFAVCMSSSSAQYLYWKGVKLVIRGQHQVEVYKSYMGIHLFDHEMLIQHLEKALIEQKECTQDVTIKSCSLVTSEMMKLGGGQNKAHLLPSIKNSEARKGTATPDWFQQVKVVQDLYSSLTGHRQQPAQNAPAGEYLMLNDKGSRKGSEIPAKKFRAFCQRQPLLDSKLIAYHRKDENHELVMDNLFNNKSLLEVPVAKLLTPLPLPTEPNQRIHADLFGPLKCEDGSKRFVLCCTDDFSKIVELVVLPNKEAGTVGSANVNKWICCYGVPLDVVTDGGLEFKNKLFAEIQWPNFEASNPAKTKIIDIDKGCWTLLLLKMPKETFGMEMFDVHLRVQHFLLLMNEKTRDKVNGQTLNLVWKKLPNLSSKRFYKNRCSDSPLGKSVQISWNLLGSPCTIDTNESPQALVVLFQNTSWSAHAASLSDGFFVSDHAAWERDDINYGFCPNVSAHPQIQDILVQNPFWLKIHSKIKISVQIECNVFLHGIPNRPLFPKRGREKNSFKRERESSKNVSHTAKGTSKFKCYGSCCFRPLEGGREEREFWRDEEIDVSHAAATLVGDYGHEEEIDVSHAAATLDGDYGHEVVHAKTAMHTLTGTKSLSQFKNGLIVFSKKDFDGTAFFQHLPPIQTMLGAGSHLLTTTSEVASKLETWLADGCAKKVENYEKSMTTKLTHLCSSLVDDNYGSLFVRGKKEMGDKETDNPHTRRCEKISLPHSHTHDAGLPSPLSRGLHSWTLMITLSNSVNQVATEQQIESSQLPVSFNLRKSVASNELSYKPNNSGSHWASTDKNWLNKKKHHLADGSARHSVDSGGHLYNLNSVDSIGSRDVKGSKRRTSLSWAGPSSTKCNSSAIQTGAQKASSISRQTLMVQSSIFHDFPQLSLTWGGRPRTCLGFHQLPSTPTHLK